MPRSRDLLYPPILQVLEEGFYQRTYHEGISSVIKWVDFRELGLDPAKYKLRCHRRPQTPLSYLMKTIDLRDAESAQEGIEHFSFIVRFPEDEIDSDHSDSWETRTTFRERRPSTSRGFRDGYEQQGRIQGVLSSLARKLKPHRKTDVPPLQQAQQQLW